jgi:hypothetical protein
MTSAPAGWTAAESTTATLARMAIYWKIAAGEPSFWQWGTSASCSWVCEVVAVQNADGGTPIDASAISSNASQTGIIALAIAPASPNDLLIGFFGTRVLTTIAPDGAMAELQDTQGNALVTLETAIQSLVAAGNTGSRSATAGAAAVNIGWLGAIKAGAARGDPLFWSL